MRASEVPDSEAAVLLGVSGAGAQPAREPATAAAAGSNGS
jgi:hypothetical protein